ncbi:CG31326, partial [Drosophila busckii]
YVGSLTLLDDQETTKTNLANGWPINYRVDFPIPNSPPKLTLIRLNSNVLCSSGQYARPRTSIALMHSLHSTVPLSFVRPRPQFVEQPIYNVSVPDFRAPIEQSDVGSRVQPRPQTVEQPRPRPQPQPRPEPPVQQSARNPQQLSAICGRERAVTTPLIFQGKPLERGQLPWLVGLFERDQDSAQLTFFCGGTLLSASTVLSAAHCFRFPGRDLPASRTVVSLGRNTLDLISDGQLSDVSQLLIHEQYKPVEYTQADLMLIRLAAPVIFDDYIVPICLWSEQLPLQLPSGYKSYVAGWGADELGNVNTRVSKITDTDIVTESNCLRELPARLVQANTICANKAGAGPCASDGGGGLMLHEQNLWILRGVISGGQRKDNTCDLSKPAVYTDVAKHISWVRQNMWN